MRPGEPFQKFIDRGSGFQIFEKRGHRDACPREYECSANLVFAGFDRFATFPPGSGPVSVQGLKFLDGVRIRIVSGKPGLPGVEPPFSFGLPHIVIVYIVATACARWIFPPCNVCAFRFCWVSPHPVRTKP